MNATGWQTNPYRSFRAIELIREREVLQWDLADLDARPEAWQFVPESRAFLVHTLRGINDEINRRKRLTGKPNAPAWPVAPVDRRAELEEIKRRLRISDLIARKTHKYGEFERRRGNDVWCCCPLPGHDEDTASFHFDDVTGVWHCFGCKRGGDLFELARHLYGCELFTEAVDWLRGLAGIERSRPAQPERPNMMRANDAPAVVRIAPPRRPSYAGRR